MKGNKLLTIVMVAGLVFGLAAASLSPVSTATVSAAASKAALSEGEVDLLISTASQDYDAIIAAVEELGGDVTLQFKYARGLAATVPASAISSLTSLNGVEKISLDSLRTLSPTSRSDADVPGVSGLGSTTLDRETLGDLDHTIQSGEAFSFSGDYQSVTVNPAEISNDLDTYYNPVSMNAGPVWDTGNFGQDSLVAVIDTGIYDQHFMLAGSVVGGVDMSPDVGTDYEGFNLATNHWHGTHVSGIIAGHGGIILPNDDLLVKSIELYTGTPLPPWDDDNKLITLFGMAPGAQLYGIKVFPHTGAAVSESRIIAGIEHAIDLKVNGVYDLDVINMSIGGWNGFDGRDLEDQVVDFATSVGITVASAASNDGPYSMSIQSPGTANTSVTAGAVAHPVNTRVFWDQAYGTLGIGQYLYTDDNPQMIYFSSRGPTADGRDKPTASAVGVFVLSSFNTETAPQSIAFASGTSMATPGIAGVAALLNTHGETVGASPYDYKEAIIAGSNPLPGFDKYDQGAGFIDAAAAMTALQSDAEIGSAHPDLPNGYSVRSARPKGTLIQDVNGAGGITFDVTLAPGMAEHFYFQQHPNAERITVDFTNVDLGPTDLGLNSFEVYIQSGIHGLWNPYVDTTNVYGDASFVIEEFNTQVNGDVFGVFTQNLPLMPGFYKLVIENDWTTFDTISATVTINVDSGNNSDRPDESYRGKLADGESEGFFPVVFGPNGVQLELSWLRNYQRYSTSDMDLIVAWFDTNDDIHWEFGGATLNSPEIVIIDSPDISEVYVLVAAFDTYDKTENWTLEVFQK